MSPKRLLVAVGVLAVVCLGLYFVNPAAAWYVPKCPVRLLTGLNCPACGMQRFVHALLAGRPAEALRYNYYLAYALPYAAMFGVVWVFPRAKWSRRLASFIENKWVVWFYVASFCVWFVVRNILGF